MNRSSDRRTHLHVLHVIDSLVPGGAERSLAAMAPHYVAGGVTLDVAYLRAGAGLQDDLADAGVDVFPLTGGGGRTGMLRRTAALVAGRRPDLVHTTLFEAGVAGRLAARRARVPVVTSLASEMYGPAHFANPALSRRKIQAAQVVEAVTLRLAVRVHAVSAHVADTMSRHLRYPRDRIDVVPRGRDPNELGRRTPERRAAARGRLGLDPGTPTILAIARHHYAKGLDVLLDAFACLRTKLPSVRLLVAGEEGTATAELSRRISALGLAPTVALLGGRGDVAELLCAADVFVLASRREGFPGAVLEAMALEAPIVATDLPQVREVVADDGALLVPPESPAALARALGDSLRTSSAAARRVQYARDRFAARFTIDRITNEMIAFYERSLTASPGR